MQAAQADSCRRCDVADEIAIDLAANRDTRGAVIDIAAELGVPLQESDMTRYDIWCADECFLTGSGAEVIPVVKLDGRVIGSGKPGPITHRVLEAFRRRVLIEGTRI